MRNAHVETKTRSPKSFKSTNQSMRFLVYLIRGNITENTLQLIEGDVLNLAIKPSNNDYNHESQGIMDHGTTTESTRSY